MYVYDQAHVLSKAIREMEEYKSLKRQNEKINADPALKKLLIDYRTKQFDLQRLQMLGQKVPEEAARMFGQLHDNVIANPALKAFLEAERRFGLMMSEVQKILVEGLEFH